VIESILSVLRPPSDGSKASLLPSNLLARFRAVVRLMSAGPLWFCGFSYLRVQMLLFICGTSHFLLHAWALPSDHFHILMFSLSDFPFPRVCSCFGVSDCPPVCSIHRGALCRLLCVLSPPALLISFYTLTPVGNSAPPNTPHFFSCSSLFSTSF